MNLYTIITCLLALVGSTGPTLGLEKGPLGRIHGGNLRSFRLTDPCDVHASLTDPVRPVCETSQVFHNNNAPLGGCSTLSIRLVKLESRYVNGQSFSYPGYFSLSETSLATGQANEWRTDCFSAAQKINHEYNSRFSLALFNRTYLYKGSLHFYHDGPLKYAGIKGPSLATAAVS